MSATYRGMTVTGTAKLGPGKLVALFISSASNTPLVTVYDSRNASTNDPTILAQFVPAVGAIALTGSEAGVGFTNGLYIVISGTVSLTAFFN